MHHPGIMRMRRAHMRMIASGQNRSWVCEQIRYFIDLWMRRHAARNPSQ